MARTWTLHDDTLAEIPGGPIPAWQFPLNNAGTVVYIASFSLPTVFSYDGVTLTDISGATFSSLAQASIRGICNFKGDIYVAYVNGSGQARVARWDGGQSWTNVYEPSDITIEAFSSSVGKFLGADANRMMLAISESASPFESYFVATTNGATWTRQTVGGGAVTDIRQNQVLGGPENGNNYGQMLAQYYDTVATKLKTIVHNSGNDWLALTSAGYNWNDRHIVGYWDERSFYEDRNGVVYDLEQSTDWGDSVAATGIPTSDGLSINEHQMFYIASDALMALVNHTSYLDQAYTWDAVTEQFIEDGTCAANQIYGFFRLGDHIYAITDGGDNGIQIFDGGSIEIANNHFRYAGLAADNANLYATLYEYGVMKLQVIDLATLTLARESEFGEATIEEVFGDWTYGIMPVVRPGDDGLLYLRGRDGNDVHVQVSVDYGASFADQDIPEWAAEKFVAALLPNPLNPVEMTAVFGDGEIFTSPTGGENWSKSGDAMIYARVRTAARHLIDENEMMIAGTEDGELSFTPNYGESNIDVSDAGIDEINVIEVIR